MYSDEEDEESSCQVSKLYTIKVGGHPPIRHAPRGTIPLANNSSPRRLHCQCERVPHDHMHGNGPHACTCNGPHARTCNGMVLADPCVHGHGRHPHMCERAHVLHARGLLYICLHHSRSHGLPGACMVDCPCGLHEACMLNCPRGLHEACMLNGPFCMHDQWPTCMWRACSTAHMVCMWPAPSTAHMACLCVSRFP